MFNVCTIFTWYYAFSTTAIYKDTGWKHYANKWEALIRAHCKVDGDGKRGFRVKLVAPLIALL